MRMNKIKNNEQKIKCCPMGYMRDESVIDCYYFGLVTYNFCKDCDYRKTNKLTYENSGK